MINRRVLSDEQVKDIKKKYKTGLFTEKDLAIQYKVSIMTISLWLRDNPYEIIRSKYRKKKPIDFTKFERCKVCTILLKIGTNCNCREPVKYFSELEDLRSYL